MKFLHIIHIASQVLLAFSIVLTSFQQIRYDKWWIRVADFPHIQLTLLTACSLLVCCITSGSLHSWSWLLPALGLLTLIYQIYIIFPYTPLAKKQAKDSDNTPTQHTLSILESNVYMYNRQYDKLVQLITQYTPDVVIALETDLKWDKALSTIESEYKHRVKVPLDNTYGILFYTKLPVISSKINYLISPEIPSLEIELQLGQENNRVRLYVVHPEPPSPTENERSTERDAELVVVGKMVAQSSLPIIVAGDLNDVAWSHTTRLFQRISGLLDPRIGRGFFNTYNVNHHFLRWPLDHLFHSHHFLVKQMKRLSPIGSDHFPILIELSMEPNKGQVMNEEVEACDADDIKEAREKLEEV